MGWNNQAFFGVHIHCIQKKKKNVCVYVYIYTHTLAQNQHIRMISEGSCDPEDWSNYAENSDIYSE